MYIYIYMCIVVLRTFVHQADRPDNPAPGGAISDSLLWLAALTANLWFCATLRCERTSPAAACHVHSDMAGSGQVSLGGGGGAAGSLADWLQLDHRGDCPKDQRRRSRRVGCDLRVCGGHYAAPHLCGPAIPGASPAAAAADGREKGRMALPDCRRRGEGWGLEVLALVATCTQHALC